MKNHQHLVFSMCEEAMASNKEEDEVEEEEEEEEVDKWPQDTRSDAQRPMPAAAVDLFDFSFSRIFFPSFSSFSSSFPSSSSYHPPPPPPSSRDYISVCVCVFANHQLQRFHLGR